MEAEISVLFKSPLLRLLDVRCKARPGDVSDIEPVNHHEISFTRTGYFGLRVGKQQYDIDTCSILLENAGTEHVVTHGPEVRDTCTLLRFPVPLLEQLASYYWNKTAPQSLRTHHFDFPYSVISSSPALDSLHLQMIHAVNNHPASGLTLKMEELEMELLQELFVRIYGHGNSTESPTSLKERNQYLELIERAKRCMVEQFDQELCLTGIARQSHSSAFHFSRIFKQFTSYSPYQYLMEVRLKHAAMLLHNTSLSVTEICFASGFSSFPHFIATFTRRHGINPTGYRKKVMKDPK
jgi:AraC family transcriptional regulator